MKKVYKKKIVITGGNGLIGSNFSNKLKHKYRIIKYPYKIQHFNKFNKWIVNKDFDYFVHFAALTKKKSLVNKKKINLINVKATKKIISSLNKQKIKSFKFFLFISSSHVYGYSNKKISENMQRTPQNKYGFSKKKIEDYIIKNRKNLYFKTGIARLFNITGKNQREGFFIKDIIQKINKGNKISNINKYRDFIHIDDVIKSLKLIISKEYQEPINVCSGKKTNLIEICKMINDKFFKKRIYIDYKRGKDLFGDNRKLKKLGINKFKNINYILDTLN